MTSDALRSFLLIIIGIGLGSTTKLGFGQQSVNGNKATPSNPTYADRSDDRQAAFDLGALQIDLNEFEAAETAYLRGIELLIQESGEFSPQLIGPYRQLAAIYVQLGQHAETLTVLEHARHIHQRNYGLFSTEQTPIINEMSQAYQAMGNTRGALELQEENLNIARRYFGRENLEIIPFYYRLAEYYELSRMRTKARESYQDVIDILEIHLDERASEQLKPLRELVRIDTFSGKKTSARRRLEELLELGSDYSTHERALSLAVLGDYELATGRAETSISRYQEAYATLAVDNAAAAEALFAKPALINFIPPASPVDRKPGISTYAWGTIAAEFEITAGGLARNVIIIEATPPNLMENLYQQLLMESYFRPRLIAGEPVATSPVRFRHRFRYFPSE